MRHWFTACLLACALAATGFRWQPAFTHVLDSSAGGLEHVLNRVGYMGRGNPDLKRQQK